MDALNYRGEGLTDKDAAGAVLDGPRDIKLYNGSGAAITKGEAVAIVPTLTVEGYMTTIETLDISDARPDLIAGGAIEDIPDGEWGFVRVRGIQEAVSVTNATAAGAGLSIGAVDGRLSATATDHSVAICQTLAASNQATVFWMNKMGL